MIKTWSADGSYVLLGVPDLGTVYVVDRETGSADKLPFLIDLPDVQRIAPK